MGIRFLCPNGHKLNVKAFLAGKRGICPQCDARFLVPSESGGQAVAIEEVSEADLPEPAVLAPPKSPLLVPPLAPPLEMPTAASPSPTVGELAPPEVWYVRTASGEQFGPASIEVIRSWVTEGRVAADCWVWRTGWPEWKSGGQAIAWLNGPPLEVTLPDVRLPDVRLPDVTLPDVTLPDATSPQIEQQLVPIAETPIKVPADVSAGQLPEPSSATLQYRSSKRSRQERARKVTFFLGGVVLLLVAVLVAVLVRSK